jgi:hypothetical protein
MVRTLHTAGNKQSGKRAFTQKLLEKYFYIPDIFVNSTKSSLYCATNTSQTDNFVGCSIFTNAIHENV